MERIPKMGQKYPPLSLTLVATRLAFWAMLEMAKSVGSTIILASVRGAKVVRDTVFRRMNKKKKGVRKSKKGIHSVCVKSNFTFHVLVLNQKRNTKSYVRVMLLNSIQKQKGKPISIQTKRPATN